MRANRQPVAVGQHQVEDNQVRLDFVDGQFCFVCGINMADAVVPGNKPVGDHRRQAGVVFHQQDQRLACASLRWSSS